jgi:hypothetical protein
MENYINNFKNFDKTIVYKFTTGGGVGDYLKFGMIILTECMNNNIKFYYQINNLEIEKYIKFKYDFFNITTDEISKLNDVTIKIPNDYYHVGNGNGHIGNIYLNEVFYLDNSIKLNVKNLIPSLPSNYISVHLRMGDVFLETDKDFVNCPSDERFFSEEKIYKFIEDNSDKNIIFFCDNNNYRLKIKDKYKNIIITNSQIGHSGLVNTTKKQILDTITDFYILSNSQLICGVVYSGFSFFASKFTNIEYIGL